MALPEEDEPAEGIQAEMLAEDILVAAVGYENDLARLTVFPFDTIGAVDPGFPTSPALNSLRFQAGMSGIVRQLFDARAVRCTLGSSPVGTPFFSSTFS